MNNTFNFELVSPEAKLISEPVWQVSFPEEEGDVGVRAGHMALVMSIRPGVVEVMLSEQGEKKRVFIAGGFADVAPDHCTILAEQAVDLASLDTDKLERELLNLSEDLSLANTATERARLQKRMDLISTMLHESRRI